MKRLILAGSSLFLAGVLFMLPSGVSAQTTFDTNVGCGLGNMLFEASGQDRILHQILAVTTNGTFGNQTFGISSGTLGCQQPTKIASHQKLERFVADNMDSLAQDMAAGRGEAVSTLAELMNVSVDERAAFYTLLQANFNNIYTASSVEYSAVIENINRIVSNS
ncbi:MAG: hypothetical protein A2052_07715 [Deltaproteobacteria bacterium GWA2_54_12]|nr:MAG: hypothetical protein A2052_07715 [Deltaproteobacteria bacterium GWA2_54_12]